MNRFEVANIAVIVCVSSIASALIWTQVDVTLWVKIAAVFLAIFATIFVHERWGSYFVNKLLEKKKK